MDFKGLLKKYWFVGLLGILLIVFIGVYAVDAYKNKELTVSSKQIDGNYVVYSVDEEDVFADDFFNSLYTENGLNCTFTAYQRAILNKAYETTEDMETIASNYAAYLYQQYGKEYVESQLQQMGYTDGTNDLINYYIDSQKRDLLIGDFLKANAEKYVQPYIDENDPRVIYHILVKVADVSAETDADGKTIYTANPTEEEAAKLQSVLDALKDTSKSFQEIAAEFSDDSSGQAGGYIGVISNANGTNYYPVFTETSMKLASNEISEPVTSQAGYHIIWNAGNSIDTLAVDNSFIQAIEQSDQTLALRAIVEKGNELGFEIVDETLKSMLDANLESGDAQ